MRKTLCKILVMGLPGAGKTVLANAVSEVLRLAGHSVERLNADEARRKHNDWDFSVEGRLRQSRRMRELADVSNAAYVICDFIAPLPEMRSTFDADITIWVDTIQESVYKDTNDIFVPPAAYDVRVDSQRQYGLKR